MIPDIDTVRLAVVQDDLLPVEDRSRVGPEPVDEGPSQPEEDLLRGRPRVRNPDEDPARLQGSHDRVHDAHNHLRSWKSWLTVAPVCQTSDGFASGFLDTAFRILEAERRYHPDAITPDCAMVPVECSVALRIAGAGAGVFHATQSNDVPEVSGDELWP